MNIPWRYLTSALKPLERGSLHRTSHECQHDPNQWSHTVMLSTAALPPGHQFLFVPGKGEKKFDFVSSRQKLHSQNFQRVLPQFVQHSTIHQHTTVPGMVQNDGLFPCKNTESELFMSEETFQVIDSNTLAHLLTVLFFMLPCLETCKIFQCLPLLQSCIPAQWVNMPPQHRAPHCKASRTCLHTWPNAITFPSLTHHLSWTVTHAENETILLCVSSKECPLGVRDSLWSVTWAKLEMVHNLKLWHYLSHTEHLSSLSWIHVAQLSAIPLPKPRQHHADNTGHLCHISVSAYITLGLKPTFGWKQRVQAQSSTYHFVFKGSFKLQPSVTGASVVNDNNDIAQGGQSVQTEILDSFEAVVHQLYLEEEQGHNHRQMESRGHLRCYLYLSSFKGFRHFYYVKLLRSLVPATGSPLCLWSAMKWTLSLQ